MDKLKELKRVKEGEIEPIVWGWVSWGNTITFWRMCVVSLESTEKNTYWKFEET